MGVMIIDSHSHWLPEEIILNSHFYSKSWGDVESQVKMMDEAGIDTAVISYPTTDAYLKLGGNEAVSRIYNDTVARIIKKFPGRFIGAALVPVGSTRAMCDEVRHATEELGFRALSLATSYDGVYIDDQSFMAVYELAQKRRIPVFVHPQIVKPIGSERVQDPLLTPVIEYVFETTMCIGRLLMSEVFQRFPGLAFIFAYFGGVVCHLPHRFDATYGMLRGINFVKDLKARPTDYLKNIYVDTSGDTHQTNFLAAFELVGPGHVVWGSDWPAKKDIRASIDAVNALAIENAHKQAIMGGTLQGLIGL